MGYITVNTFFKSINGRALREYFSKGNFDLTIIDFRGQKIFKKKNAYTCICLIKNKTSPSTKYIYSATSDLSNITNAAIQTINYTDLDSKSGWNLNNRILLSKIESTGTPFNQLFKTRNGIATLKNDVFIFSPVKEDSKYYYLKNEIIFKIEKTICKDIINSNILTRVNSIKGHKKKIIFPYAYANNELELLEERFMAKQFPCAYAYLFSQKAILAERDKGVGAYPKWYAYGRNQSLERYKFKLLFPHITSHIPNYIISSDPDLLFVNGMALVSEQKRPLLVMRKIMSSRLFWFYIINSSKPYGSSYFSLSRNYIKNFGVYNFNQDDIKFILKEKNQIKLDRFIEKKYGISF